MNDNDLGDRLDFSLYKMQWVTMSSCLSMDISSPFYTYMGVPLPFSGSFKQSFRKIELEIRERKNCASLTDQMICEYKYALSKKFGEEWLKNFMLWFLVTYSEESFGWSNWRALIEVIADASFYEDLKKNSVIGDDKIMLLKKYKDYCFFWENTVDETANRLSQLRISNLSSWDEEIIQYGNYKIELLLNDETTLFDERSDIFQQAIRVISMKRFQNGWGLLWDNFTGTEKNQITESADKLLSSVSGAYNPNYLPHPDTLIRI